jgi:hypothetical protein
MMDWFAAGGFGMFMILAIGVGAIGYGAKTVRAPSRERLAVLRALPGLVVMSALFTFGTGLWAVNRALGNDAFLKAHAAGEGQQALLGIVGFTEAGQAFTLAALLAMIVLALRVVAEARHARQAAETRG